MIRSIPISIIRGGSSKGVYFKKSDLPHSEIERKDVLLKVMEGNGLGDNRQIDGLGGATSLTSKIAIVSRSDDSKADLDYHFYQVVMGKAYLSDSQNCGNILAGVLPFAIQEGLIKADSQLTTKVIKMLNSNSYCEVTIETPDGIYNPIGSTTVHGVPGSGSPVLCNYLDIAGKNTGNLLSTGNTKDIIEGIEVTCVDNGMPVVLLRARDLGLTGYETKAELDQNTELKSQLEKIRLKIGLMMNLGDVSEKTVPKMTIISEPKNGGLINTRTFIPHVCHAAIGVLGAVSAITGCLLPGSVAEDIIGKQNLISGTHNFVAEHPSGILDVSLTVENTDENLAFPKSGVLRTARILSQGVAFLP